MKENGRADPRESEMMVVMQQHPQKQQDLEKQMQEQN